MALFLGRADRVFYGLFFHDNETTLMNKMNWGDNRDVLHPSLNRPIPLKGIPQKM
jgi:hypothetical protein